jgi:uncharacterized protein (TIGR02001 family)
MRRTILFLALAGFGSSAMAASASATFTLASDYLFDGISQTQGSDDDDFNPALQASIDFEGDNGFYFGIWGSNVDFGDGDPASVEIDYYLGFAGETGNGWGWDVGALYYTYTGAPTSYDYAEGLLGITAPFGTSASLYFGDDDGVFGGQFYRVKFKHSFALGETWSLDLEGTRSEYDDDGAEDYTHGQIGVSREFGRFSGYLGYSDTSLDDNPNADGRLLFTLSTSIDIF